MSLTDLRFPLERLTWEQFHMDLSRNAGYALGILILVVNLKFLEKTRTMLFIGCVYNWRC